MASSNDNGKFRSTQGNARLAPDFLAQNGCHGMAQNFKGINPGIWGSKLWDPRCNYNGVVLLKKLPMGREMEWFGDVWWTMDAWQHNTNLKHLSTKILLHTHITYTSLVIWFYRPTQRPRFFAFCLRDTSANTNVFVLVPDLRPGWMSGWEFAFGMNMCKSV